MVARRVEYLGIELYTEQIRIQLLQNGSYSR